MEVLLVIFMMAEDGHLTSVDTLPHHSLEECYFGIEEIQRALPESAIENTLMMCRRADGFLRPAR